MFTITRRQDVGDTELPIGTATTADELHALLFDAFRPGVYVVRNPAGRTVRCDLEAPINDNLEFSRRIVQVLTPREADQPRAA